MSRSVHRYWIHPLEYVTPVTLRVFLKYRIKRGNYYGLPFSNSTNLTLYIYDVVDAIFL